MAKLSKMCEGCPGVLLARAMNNQGPELPSSLLMWLFDGHRLSDVAPEYGLDLRIPCHEDGSMFLHLEEVFFCLAGIQGLAEVDLAPVRATLRQQHGSPVFGYCRAELFGGIINSKRMDVVAREIR